jgi:hypothetical protein
MIHREQNIRSTDWGHEACPVTVPEDATERVSSQPAQGRRSHVANAESTKKLDLAASSPQGSTMVGVTS